MITTHNSTLHNHLQIKCDKQVNIIFHSKRYGLELRNEFSPSQIYLSYISAGYKYEFGELR